MVFRESGDLLIIQIMKNYCPVCEKSDRRILNLSVYPNPFVSRTDIRWQIADNRLRIAEFKIFDSSGREVKSFIVTGIGHPSSVIWRGDDKVGPAVPLGVYFLVGRAEGYGETIKIVYLGR